MGGGVAGEILVRALEAEALEVGDVLRGGVLFFHPFIDGGLEAGVVVHHGADGGLRRGVQEAKTGGSPEDIHLGREDFVALHPRDFQRGRGADLPAGAFGFSAGERLLAEGFVVGFEFGVFFRFFHVSLGWVR